jgi:chemotaxis protein methyltransferase CheR
VLQAHSRPTIPPMQKHLVEDIEVSLLLEGIFRRYGYDFRNYARASIKRRIHNLLQKTGHREISEIIPLVLHDENFFAHLLSHFSIPVTEMFRDPYFFKQLRREVIPQLQKHPFLKIWHAGCATGEEVYSLAILLLEEGLYARATIFATDFNDEVLQRAKKASYSIKNLATFDKNYELSGGLKRFSHYYHIENENIILEPMLQNNITFANHNLVTDGVFGEMHLILCRNVLIYFDKTLQDRVLELLTNSLINRGFLCLGNKESLIFSSIVNHFIELDVKERIYQKNCHRLHNR